MDTDFEKGEEGKEEKSFKKTHLKCSRCGSTNCYTNKDKTQICRKCGFREIKEI